MQPETFSETLDLMCNHSLTLQQVKTCFRKMVLGEFNSLHAVSFLTALKIKGESETDLLGALEVMRSLSRPFPLAERQDPIVDCCGTGGDGLHTYNISTACALVLAELGLKVAKHGSRKISSSCGSADILEAFGVAIQSPPENAAINLLNKNFCFLLASDYNQAAQTVQAARHALQSKTIFNLLGPLLNPANPDYQLIGVYSPKPLLTMAKVLKQKKVKGALVVHGSGFDEIAVHDKTHGYLLQKGNIMPFHFHPHHVGYPLFPLHDLISTSKEDNISAFLELIKGQGKPALKASVAINAGALLYVAEGTSSIQVGVKKVAQLLETDRVYQRLCLIKEESHAA